MIIRRIGGPGDTKRIALPLEFARRESWIGIGKNVILKYRMPSFDFVQTSVSAFVLGFLLVNVILYAIDQFKNFKEGFEGDDYASKISTDMSDLFEKVNKQLEIAKTLVIPISTDTITISYNRNLTPSMSVYGNLLTVVNDGVMRVENNLRNVTSYQYIGNSSIQTISDELTKINESTVLAKCASSTTESFVTATTTAPTVATTIPVATTPIATTIPVATTTATTIPVATTTATNALSAGSKDECLRKNEYEFIQRVMVIVDSHQKIINKILEKKSDDDTN